MKQQCRVSGQAFEIFDKDIQFYQHLKVPPPTLCPEERMRRRLMFRNESKLYHRTCAGTGKNIVSMYGPAKVLPVYDNDYWWKDSWDGRDYGRDFNFSRRFFEQLGELLRAVPKMARIQQGDNENSTYCNCAAYNRNCHLLFGAFENNGCLYGNIISNSTDCADCTDIQHCELCYECVYCSNCYAAAYLDNCKNCSESYFLLNCSGCTHCFGSVNLRNQSYYFLNQPCSREKYFNSLKLLELHSGSKLELIKQRWQKLKSTKDVPYYQGSLNEDVSGDYISNSRNAFSCFNVYQVEDCRYCDSLWNSKDCADVSYYGATGLNELLLECEGVGHGVFEVMFSKLIWGGSSNVLYSYECFASEHLFGCAGLKRARCCIFNRQYSEDDYFRLKDRIIRHMQTTREWGEFFPPALSLFGYNETVAQEWLPLTREECRALKLSWYDTGQRTPGQSVEQAACTEELLEVNPSLAGKTIRCQTTANPYRLEQPELKLLRRLGFPIPRLCPEERMRLRQLRRNRRVLCRRACDSCGCSLQTTFSASTQQVLCKECYETSLN